MFCCKRFSGRLKNHSAQTLQSILSYLDATLVLLHLLLVFTGVRFMYKGGPKRICSKFEAVVARQACIFNLPKPFLSKKLRDSKF